jgi:hypothetical protein
MAVPLAGVLLGALFLVFAAAAGGLWAWIVAGILLLASLGYGVRKLIRGGHDLAADDLPGPQLPRDPTTYNVLVIADEHSSRDPLRGLVEEHAAGRPVTAFVVAPVLSSRLDQLTGDESAYERAHGNLDATLRALERVTESRQGRLGSHDPVQAIGEALREFPAEEVLLPAHSDDWPDAREESVAETVEARYGVRVTAIGSDDGDDREEEPWK